MFLEVRIPKELVNWQAKRNEQIRVKTPHVERTSGARPQTQKQNPGAKTKETPLIVRATRWRARYRESIGAWQSKLNNDPQQGFGPDCEPLLET